VTVKANVHHGAEDSCTIWCEDNQKGQRCG
jgi:hypothetical protein